MRLLNKRTGSPVVKRWSGGEKLTSLAKAALISLLFGAMVFCSLAGVSDADELPYYLADRGKGVPLSMFGTYIESGHLIIYPFYEYYHDKDAEYDPSEFGYGTVEQEYRGKYEAHEGLIFIGYGISENVAAEFEVAVISARLEKASDDTSTMPDEIKESGLGDVEGQLRWRFLNEDDKKPELFTYFETVFPLQKSKKIIGTQDWEFKLGVGATKGFHFGTLTVRTAVAYEREENKFELGEYAIEYLKRLSDHFRFFAAIEGEDDEVELIPEIQWHINENVIVKLNVGYGLTSKATDFAPEMGVMFIF